MLSKRKGYFPILFLGLLSFVGLFFYIFFIDPTKSLTAGKIFISPIILFFVLLLTGLSCFGAFLFINIRRGVLLGLFLSAILLLRYMGFVSYLYIGILLIIVILIELGFRKR